MNIECSYYYALHFLVKIDKNCCRNISNLTFEYCYKKRAINIEKTLKYSQYLIDLFSNCHSLSCYFLTKSRQINALLAYYSIEMNTNARAQNITSLQTFQL